ncbi:MAG: hypothetical protein JSU57_02250 [Candidatus Heimdallarchaeota archaeon]|nr:MAG: hypothetical protein JSU57_02250 [Candidatus Heimdallarchaeota archaeon]
MLFQVQLPHHKSDSDSFLRSSLISALYSFVSQVEEDTINALQMAKVTFMFRKQNDLIFMLALDSTINPVWCEADFEYLIQEFFRTFPEVQWQGEVVLNLRIFDTFKEEVKKHLVRLNRRLELGIVLLNERLITDDEFLAKDLEVLGMVVAQRLLQSYQLREAIHQRRDILAIIDTILDSLNGSHIERQATQYILDCDVCLLCPSSSDCFFETFLDTLLTYFNFKQIISQYEKKRTLKWSSSSHNELKSVIKV